MDIVLSICVVKAIQVRVLKLLKLQKPKALRLMSLMNLLVASSLAIIRQVNAISTDFCREERF